jgi:hypothetical protein
MRLSSVIRARASRTSNTSVFGRGIWSWESRSAVATGKRTRELSRNSSRCSPRRFHSLVPDNQIETGDMGKKDEKKLSFQLKTPKGTRDCRRAYGLRGIVRD